MFTTHCLLLNDSVKLDTQLVYGVHLNLNEDSWERLNKVTNAVALIWISSVLWFYRSRLAKITTLAVTMQLFVVASEVSPSWLALVVLATPVVEPGAAVVDTKPVVPDPPVLLKVKPAVYLTATTQAPMVKLEGAPFGHCATTITPLPEHREKQQVKNCSK